MIDKLKVKFTEIRIIKEIFEYFIFKTVVEITVFLAFQTEIDSTYDPERSFICNCT